jgi:hypothetical protein
MLRSTSVVPTAAEAIPGTALLASKITDNRKKLLGMVLRP